MYILSDSRDSTSGSEFINKGIKAIPVMIKNRAKKTNEIPKKGKKYLLAYLIKYFSEEFFSNKDVIAPACKKIEMIKNNKTIIFKPFEKLVNASGASRNMSFKIV